MAKPADSTEPTPIASAEHQTMNVKVYAPFTVYYEGEAEVVSAVNAVGPFDIMQGHHNFLCMLVPCALSIKKADGTIKKVKISRALMHVKQNQVDVFVDV